MPTFSYPSLSQALAQLGERLYDSKSQFWTNDEKTLYIQEALRTFNSLASFWRSDFIFNTVQGIQWYDITNPTQCPNTLRPMTVADVDLFQIIQYHLLEPPSGTTWSGSKQFNEDDLQQAVQRKRDEVLGNSGCTLTQGLVGAPTGSPPAVVVMPDTTLEIRRVAWIPVGSPIGFSPSVMYQSDVWAGGSFVPLYPTNNPGTPSTYYKSAQPPISFLPDTAPAVPGQYDVLSIQSGGLLDLHSPSILPIPDDWTWVLKWGALADLLSIDSVSKDPQRAQYCQARYRMGLDMLMRSPALLALRLNNIPTFVDSVFSADCFNPGWQAASQGPPDAVLTAGLNLLAITPPPNAGPYGVAATVVQNAPLPQALNDPIQMSRDNYDSILDYAQHLASFKMGGDEFMSSSSLLDSFLKQAGKYNSKLAQMGEYQPALYQVSQKESEDNPRYLGQSDREKV